MLAVIGAANRDEHRYDDPDRFDIHRDPQPHISFGSGRTYVWACTSPRTEIRVRRWNSYSHGSPTSMITVQRRLHRRHRVSQPYATAGRVVWLTV